MPTKRAILSALSRDELRDSVDYYELVMPHGVLFREAAEGKIRQGLLQQDLFEAVIGLPPNLFYGTGIPASILVLNRDKPSGRHRKVLFIDASREFGDGINQNRLRDEDIQHISTTFHTYADAETYARVVPLSEIQQNDWNLNISRYVDITPAEEDPVAGHGGTDEDSGVRLVHHHAAEERSRPYRGCQTAEDGSHVGPPYR